MNKEIDGPNKPNTLRRLSERNIKFARSVGRRLSTILNLPVGYDVHDPKMIDCIQETEESPETKRRDSVTVSSDMNPANVNDTDVFVYENDLYVNDNVNNIDKTAHSGVRKRFVNTSVQTDTNNDTLFTPKTDDKPKHIHLQTKTPPFSLRVTSVSIKFAASKPYAENQAGTSANNGRNVNGKITENDDDICKQTEEQIIQYTADDVPKARAVDNALNKNFCNGGIEPTPKTPYSVSNFTNSIQNNPVSPPKSHLHTRACNKTKTVLHISASNSAANIAINGEKENHSKGNEETDLKEGFVIKQNSGCLEQMEDSSNESDYEPITFGHPKLEQKSSSNV